MLLLSGRALGGHVQLKLSIVPAQKYQKCPCVIGDLHFKVQYKATLLSMTFFPPYDDEIL